MQVLIKKKYLILILSIIIVCVVAIICFNMFFQKNKSFDELLKKNPVTEKVYQTGNYSLKVKKIDDYSFDRLLEVYYDDKKIEFDSIEYTDGVVLCSGDKAVIYYGNISKENELIVVLKNKERIKIKIGE